MAFQNCRLDRTVDSAFRRSCFVWAVVCDIPRRCLDISGIDDKVLYDLSCPIRGE